MPARILVAMKRGGRGREGGVSRSGRDADRRAAQTRRSNGRRHRSQFLLASSASASLLSRVRALGVEGLEIAPIVPWSRAASQSTHRHSLFRDQDIASRIFSDLQVRAK